MAAKHVPNERSARDPVASRSRLVEAATREFCDHGYSGARVDQIAAAARTNKRMIYHYFSSKEGLFAAVLQAKLGDDEWASTGAPSATQIQLMAAEARHYPNGPDRVDAMVDAGRLRIEPLGQAMAQMERSGGDGRMFAWTLFCLEAMPQLCPQYASLITGYQAGSDEYTSAVTQIRRRLLAQGDRQRVRGK